MSGINKYSILRWVLGITLVATSGIALAGSIADTYTTGDTLTATKMTAVKTAVGDNDTRITAIGAGTQTCLIGMTRVGPTCVDNARQAANQTWTAAVDFCRAANKRLLTPGEYLAAFNATVISAADGDFEWVDSVSSDHSVDNTIPGAGAGRMTVGYIGPSTSLSGDILFGTNVAYDVGAVNIFFRCAR